MATTNILKGFPGADAFPPCIIDSLTTAGTANLRTTVAHGRSYTPSVAIPILAGTDGDSAESPLGAVIEVVSITATNVVVKCATASVPFSLVIFP